MKLVDRPQPATPYVLSDAERESLRMAASCLKSGEQRESRKDTSIEGQSDENSQSGTALPSQSGSRPNESRHRHRDRDHRGSAPRKPDESRDGPAETSSSEPHERIIQAPHERTTHTAEQTTPPDLSDETGLMDPPPPTS